LGGIGFGSSESPVHNCKYEILNAIRNEIDEDNWDVQDMINYFGHLDTEFITLSTRRNRYQKYVQTWNSRLRNNGFEQEIFDNTKSIDKKSLSSKSIEPDENIDTICADKFVNIDQSFKKFKNKMMRICNINKQYSSLSDNEIKEIFTKFNKKEKQFYINIVNYPSILSLFMGYLMYNDVNFMNTSKFEVDNLKLNDEGRLDRSDGSDMGGLSRQMITNISNELFEMKIFIKPSNSTKYVFNPEFKFLEEHVFFLQIYFEKNVKKRTENEIERLKYLQRMIQTDEIYIEFYTFIGRLLSFFLMNSFKLPHHLSTHILNSFIYKQDKIKDHDHIFYVLNDFPDISNTMLNIMKTNPEDIESYGIEYNDLYKIQYDKKDGDAVTSQNFEQYFIDFAKHLNIHNTIPVSENRNLDIDFSQYYEKFTQGFNNNLRKLFQKTKISHLNIDKMLTKEELNGVILNQISDNIFRNISFTKITGNNNATDIEEYNNKGHQYVEKYRTYIHNILLNTNKWFSKEEHDTFIKKMLEFWTGIDFFKPEINYKILIEINRQTGYAVSHTCFNRVDVPLYQTEKQFFDKFRYAVENSYNTFTIAGGKGK